MKFDLKKISGFADLTGSMKSSLRESYNSSWNDPVHDSFGVFIEEYSKQIDVLSSLSERLTSICESLESVDIDEIDKKYRKDNEDKNKK